MKRILFFIRFYFLRLNRCVANCINVPAIQENFVVRLVSINYTKYKMSAPLTNKSKNFRPDLRLIFVFDCNDDVSLFFRDRQMHFQIQFLPSFPAIDLRFVIRRSIESLGLAERQFLNPLTQITIFKNIKRLILLQNCQTRVFLFFWNKFD